MLAFASFALFIAAANACNTVCNFNWAPVCGTDGKTYGNRCELESLACRARSAVAVAYEGQCTVAAKAPSCNSICNFNWAPVCGTDGKTYGNRCELESLACRARSAVVVAYEGECRQQTRSLQCNKICTRDWRPVCGNDGITYGNRCQLESFACLKKSALSVAHTGECITKAAPANVCNNICTFDWTPVCGTDGKTYGNRCQLESLSCLKKTGVTLAKNGVC